MERYLSNGHKGAESFFSSHLPIARCGADYTRQIHLDVELTILILHLVDIDAIGNNAEEHTLEGSRVERLSYRMLVGENKPKMQEST